MANQQKRKEGSRSSLVELEAILDEHFQKEDEFPGLGCALEMFREKDQIMEILHSLPNGLDESSAESTFERFRKIVDQYQEQPHLLDKHMEEMIATLLSQFRSCSNPSDPLRHLSLKFLRQLIKVRGPKQVVKRMPHEISDLVPVLNYLEMENLDNPHTWESGYVLVLWLSILVLNPFNLKLLDGNQAENECTIGERIMKVCMKCLTLNNNIGQAAPILLSKFLTRPDMQEKYMGNFIDWGCKNMQEGCPFGTRVGAFSGLAAIFKHGKRQEVVQYGERVLNAALSAKYEKCDTVLRKLGSKLIQRIGMMFMKNKTAPWRYQRGSRSLLINLKSNNSDAKEYEKAIDNTEVNYDELEQYSACVESAIDRLLQGLKDKDTVVRWSCAKGLGRITNRLPKDYADEVVEGVLQNFSPREGNGAWHGGCLALAEFSRRGLLLPERIPQVIPVIKRALTYDEIRGNFSLGAHVRDAACYVLWAFARAFDPPVVQPYVQEIATSLILTMLFDREVNCRRAASAAFQENVGRQGNFPKGIDIVTVADYFAVGIRSQAYTSLSMQIGKFQEYTKAMINHLLEFKFNHFDPNIRELTAEALGNFSTLEPNYTIEYVIPRLILSSSESDTYALHGALICLGSILVKLQANQFLNLVPDTMQRIRDIVSTIKTKKLKAGQRGGELIRQGLCLYINSLSLAKLPYHDDSEFIDMCQETLESTISSIDVQTRSISSSAYATFIREYLFNNPNKHDSVPAVIERFCKCLTSQDMTTRQGYARTLGKMSVDILQCRFTKVIESLVECASITEETNLWAESRREALNAINCIFTNNRVVPESSWLNGIPLEVVDSKLIYECFMSSLQDYTADKRGDIGSWCRESAMTASHILTVRLHEIHETGIVGPTVINQLIGLIVKQCVEKIDNIRVLAGKLFSILIHNENPVINAIPKLRDLRELFPEDFCNSVNWRSPSATFPKFAEMLRIEDYTYYLLEGFVISGGSISDSIMKAANAAVSTYILASGAMGDSELYRIGNLLVLIFKNNLKVDRVTGPLIKFLTHLLQSGILLPLLESDSDVGLNLMELAKSEVFKCNRVDKVISVVELLCEMLQGSEGVKKAALKKLMVYLCHVYPRIRVITSQKLYEALLTYENEIELENVMSLLSETQWDEDLDDVKPIRNQICDLLDIPQPVLLRATASNTSA